MPAPPAFLKACLARILELPFVEEVDFTPLGKSRGALPAGEASPTWKAAPYGEMTLVTPAETVTFLVEVQSSHLSRAGVEGVLARLGLLHPQSAMAGTTLPAPSKGVRQNPWILLAPHVGRGIGTLLDRHQLNFMDPAGNCRLQIGQQYLARVEGRAPVATGPRARGPGAAGYQVAHALLARPTALSGPATGVARLAGVSSSTVSSALNRLIKEGFLHKVSNGRAITHFPELLDHWTEGYRHVLRPHLLLDRYRSPGPDLMDLDRCLHVPSTGLGKRALGGSAAAFQLTRFYRGEETVVHIEGSAPEWARHLKLVRDDLGPVLFLKVPGPAAWLGPTPKTVSVFLIYAELLAQPGARRQEAAAELRRAFPVEFHDAPAAL